MDYLNRENINRSTADVEWHPLLPFLPVNARVLFLGSFPPPRKRWSVDFYYPNFINDHWRIEGVVWFADRNHFVDLEAKSFRLPEIVSFCTQRGIAFHDTATAVRRLRDNASDKFLEIVRPTDIAALTASLPSLRAIVTTGEKATETLRAQLTLTTIPRTGEKLPTGLKNASGEAIMLYRLPSSSRAYPLSLEKKAEAYARMFRSVFTE